MSRSRRRTSRALIGLLVIAAVFAALTQYHKLSRARAASTFGSAVKPVQAGNDVPLPPAALTPKPVLLAAVPATQPVAMGEARPAAALIPATQPAQANGQPALLASVSSTSLTGSVSAGDASTALQQAKAKMDAGELLEARTLANEALLGGSDAGAARQLLSQINQTVIFSPTRFIDDPYGGIVTVQPGQRMSKIAGEHQLTWEFLCRINKMSDPRKMRSGQSLKVLKGPFNLLITKSTFTMDVYLGAPEQPGSLYITSFKVGLGRDDSTPTGTWSPHTKLRHPLYYDPRTPGNVIASDDPKNPLGGYWIGLTGVQGNAVGKNSYGIHGTIEPDSIGKMASLGCIRMHNEDVALVFDMVVEGKSTVIVRN